MRTHHAPAGRRGSFVGKGLALTGVALLTFGSFTGTAQGLSAQAGADIDSVTFRAVTPTAYDHSTGGGLWTDGTTNLESQLLGDDFACGDYVSYMLVLDVAASPATPQLSARVSITFTADTTGQSGVALIVDDTSSAHLRTNATTEDSGATGDDGSGITNASVAPAGPRFVSGSTEVLTFDVTDLEASESVVVRADARIACQAGSSPTGNLQAALTSVDVIAPGTPGAVSGGAQTVNLVGAGDILGADEALLRVTKTLAASDGTCPGIDSLEVDLSVDDSVLACITVENYGTQPAFDLVVTDNAFTPDDNTDDVTVTMVGLTDEDGDGTADDLLGNTTVSGSAVVTIPSDGTLTNSVTAVADDNVSAAYQSTDTAEVVAYTTPPSTTTPPDLPATGSNTTGRSTGAALVFVALGGALVLLARLAPRRARHR